MKKPYTKPLVYAEAFELMEHVAGNCLVNDAFDGAHHRNAGDCAYSDGNLYLFTNDANGCQTFLFAAVGGVPDPNIPSDIVSKIEAIGMQCYNSFLATGQLFAS